MRIFKASRRNLEKRRTDRITIENQGSVFIQLLKPTTKDSAQTWRADVVNVSLRGCRAKFVEKELARQLSVGETFVATLSVEEFPIPLTVEILRIMGGGEVAVTFKPPYPQELSRLEKFLEPRCLGLSLRKIDPRYLQGEAEEGFLWFQGMNDTHLFSWMSPDRKAIRQQQLVFLGRIVEWGTDKPLRSGQVRADSDGSSTMVGWTKTELFDFDAAPDLDALNTARVILESSAIDPHVREEFLLKLKR